MLIQNFVIILQTLQTTKTHRGLHELGDVGVEVVVDPLGGPRQGHSPDEQDQQHDVGEGGGEVHRL